MRSEKVSEPEPASWKIEVRLACAEKALHLAAKRRQKNLEPETQAPAPRAPCDRPMIHTYAQKQGKPLYRYCVCAKAHQPEW